MPVPPPRPDHHHDDHHHHQQQHQQHHHQDHQHQHHQHHHQYHNHCHHSHLSELQRLLLWICFSFQHNTRPSFKQYPRVLLMANNIELPNIDGQVTWRMHSNEISQTPKHLLFIHRGHFQEAYECYIYISVWISTIFMDLYRRILSFFMFSWLRNELSMLIFQCVLGFVEKKTFVDLTGIVSYCFADWMRGCLYTIP